MITILTNISTLESSEEIKLTSDPFDSSIFSTNPKSASLNASVAFRAPITSPFATTARSPGFNPTAVVAKLKK